MRPDGAEGAGATVAEEATDGTSYPLLSLREGGTFVFMRALRSLLVVAGMSLAASEIALRIFFAILGMERYEFSTTPEGLMWKLRADQDIVRSGPNFITASSSYRITSNSLGIRSPELRDTSDVRILCVGDSDTFGQGVNSDETFPFYLERHLSREYEKDFEVINAGISGWSTAQQYIFIRGHLEELDPDILILQVNSNDFTIPIPMQFRLPGELTRYTSFTAMLLKSLLLSGAADVDPSHAGWHRSTEFLERIIRFVEEYRQDPIRRRMQVVFYNPYASPKNQLSEEFEEKMRRAASRAEHIHYWDTDCAEALRRDPSLTIPRDGHPSPAGHRLLAARLADRIGAILARFPRSGAGSPPVEANRKPSPRWPVGQSLSPG